MSKRSIHESLDPSRITYADAPAVSSTQDRLTCCLDDLLGDKPNHIVDASKMVKIRPHDPFARMRTKLERDYGNYLDGQRLLGLIDRWEYEWCMFRLSPTVTYSPDFATFKGHTLTFYETKGYWNQQGLIKFRLARDTLPFRFVAVKRVKGAWIETENPTREEYKGERAKRKAGG